jgi:glycosyltransferase involved in cell wall biosynthesis
VKKILYISYDGMTDPLGQSQVIPYLQGLSAHGYQFTILSFEKKERFRKNETILRKLLDTAGIKWEPRFFSKNPPVLSKLYDAWKMKKTVSALHKKEKFDLVHCRSYVAAAAGLRLFKKSNTPFLFDMRGFWVDERVDNGQWKLSNPFFRAAYRLYKKKEKAYLSQSAHIISLTHKGKDELVNSYNVVAGKVTVIPCCADLAHFDYTKNDPVQINEARARLQISPGDRVLIYLGTLGGWYLTEEMLVFFAELKKKIPAAKFLFITHDSRESILTKAAGKNISEADIIVQPAGRAQVPLYLALAEWSIFFIKDAYSKKASSPTKQGEIMAMGIPLICNDIGDTGYIVRETRTGLVANELSVKEYGTMVDKIDLLNKLDKSHIRASAFKYYDLRDGIEKYLDVYNRITG